jgi:hypothetical protein
MQRPFKPPGAWLIYSVGVVTSIIGVITAFFVPSPTIPTNTWLTTISVPTAAGVIIGIVIYLLGRKKAAGVSMDAEIEKYAKHLGLDAKAATAEE